MKKTIILSLFLGFVFGAKAQKAAFLVPERIEVEIIKDEIKALNTKDANYKSKLASLQSQQNMAEMAANELEDVLNLALAEEAKSSNAQVNFKSKTGQNVSWSKTSKLAAAGTPIRPPGGRPCLPGACLDFLYFLTEECPSCDFASFEKIRELLIKGKKYSIYKAPAKATINTARYKVAASQYVRK